MITASIVRSIAQPLTFACNDARAAGAAAETFNLLTEAGDSLVTEAGDNITTEDAP